MILRFSKLRTMSEAERNAAFRKMFDIAMGLAPDDAQQADSVKAKCRHVYTTQEDVEEKIEKLANRRF